MIKMEAGDVIFVRGKSLLSKIVQKFDGEYSHVVIAVSDKEVLEADFLTKVRFVVPSYEDYDILRLSLSKHQKRMIPLCADSQIGKVYDYLRVLWLAIANWLGLRGKKNLFNSPNRIICSESVALVLDCIGYDKYKKIGSLTPNELYRYLKDKEWKRLNA